MFSYAILFSLCHYFGNKIIVPFFQAFTQFITRITADVDFFTDLSDGFRNDLLDRLVRIFDEFLIEEAVFFVEFFDTADNHLFDNLFRFTFVQGLLAENFFFVFQYVSRNFFAFEVCRFCSSDLHCNVFAECFEVICLSDEVRFAVDFDENADTAVAMDVRINQTFSSDAVSLRPWVSTTPINISSPCARSRWASVSMAKVFPTPAQAPKKIFSLPRWASAVCSSSLSGSGRMGSSVI